MSVSQVLLQVLNDPDEPLEKRLKLANNAFNTTQIQIRRKEALILQWALSTPTQNHPQINASIVKWVATPEFKQITLNDITNEDIATIVKLVQTEQCAVGVQVVLQLCNNHIFQQFFKYNPKDYCELLASSAKSIDNPNEYVEFIKNPVLLPQSVLANEEFAKLFVDCLFPVLVEKTVQFRHDQVFKESTRIIERGILQGNLKNFTTFLDKLFEGEHEQTVAKSLFKFLASKLQDQDVAVYFKLFYSAFCDCFKDPNYPFKCLLLLTHLLKLDSSANFTFNLPFKLKVHHTPQLSQTLNTILELLDVLSAKSYQDCTIPDNISLSEFLRNLIKSLTSLNPTVLQIILKCIAINPLIIEPVASNLVVFIMTHDHSEFKDEYENVIVAIFEVFTKLHRVENFIAKLIPTLKSTLVIGDQTFINNPVYKIKAEHDWPIAEKLTEHKVQEMFTHSILDYISTCLIGLASWQVINVFKTLLHHFKYSTEEFAEGKFSDDSPGLVYMEILGLLTSTLLQSIKIADHTVAQNVVVKFVDGLEELRSVLKDFSGAILKRQHNHITMRTFLSLAYMWAEVYITLTYYSMNKEVAVPTVPDYSGDSLTYLHSYMTRTEWQMVEQRITNFGKSTCTRLLQKLYLQKLHAMLLLEEEVKPEAIGNVVKWLPTHLKASWRDFLEDKFAVRVLLKEIDKANLIFLGENLVEHFQKLKRSHVTDSALLTNVTLWVLIGKMNKLFRLKRKRDSDLGHSFSEKIFKLFPEDAFFSVNNPPNVDFSEAHELFSLNVQYSNVQSKEEKLLSYLETMRMLPFVYSDVQIQQMVFLYLLALTKDVVNCSCEVKTQVENLLIGVIQTSKWPLLKVVNWDIVIKHVLPEVNRHELVFSLLVDNVFRHDHQLEPLITHLLDNLSDSKTLNFAITILQAINKAKKSKLPQTTKDQLTEYKNQIITKMTKLVCKSTQLVEAYAICLKHHLTTTEKNNHQTEKLLKKLPSYLDYCFSEVSSENKKGCAILFNLVLEKRSQIASTIPQDIVSKIWGACKGNQLTQDYTHLVNLIVCSIPNEEFGKLVNDLVQQKQLKTWESVITCDVNPVKMKTLQKGLESVLFQVSLEETDTVKDIVHLHQCIIQAQHFILSPPIIDVLISTPAILISKKPENFPSTFTQAVSLLELQLKHRNPIVMDRLPVFLQQYRVLLKAVCFKSNSDQPELDVKVAGDCAHRLEKLTKSLVANKKDMSRIALFLIADILERYEHINLYPNVKLHLNNCVYALISVCDHHAVSYLMRALTRASTEMFKLMYEHYKRYYMFTGKV